MGLFSKRQAAGTPQRPPQKQPPQRTKTKDEAIAQMAREDPERMAQLLREILNKK